MKKILAAIALVISLTSGGLVGSSQALSAGTDCPSGTTFVAKYETSNTMIRFAEGADVITFSDKVANTDGELVRFDFSSTTPISFVFVKAGSDPDDSRSSDFRTRSVTTGNDLGTIKGISHISFCGPAVVTLATPTPSATPTPTPTPTPTATPIVIQIIPTPTPTVVTQVIPTPTPTPTIVSSPTPSPVVTSTPTPAVAGVQQPAIIGMVNPAVDQQPAAQAMVVPNSQQQSVAAQAAAPAGPAAQGTISGLPSSSTVAQAASGMPFGAMLLATGVFLLRRRKS